jgi:hypothetical protein
MILLCVFESLGVDKRLETRDLWSYWVYYSLINKVLNAAIYATPT